MNADAAASKVDLGLDLPEHERTYAGFVHLTENLTVHILNLVLILVLWGLEGHGFLALIFFVLNIAASAVGFATGTSWRAPAALFVLLGLACILL